MAEKHEGVDANTATHLTDEVQAVYFMQDEKAIAWIVRNPDAPAFWSAYMLDSLMQCRALNRPYERCLVTLNVDLIVAGQPDILGCKIIYSKEPDNGQ